MDRLLIHPEHLEAIGRLGEASYPKECCGFLLGRTGGGVTVVERLVAAENGHAQGRNRFQIRPETVLAVHKAARAEGVEVVGYYHSHPDHPARPSRWDCEGAWPGLSYVIVSVQAGKAAEVRSWRLAEDREGFQEEAIAPATMEVER
jgi:proteasome lid subunit RPN8/RPN11